jgi:hypothetical protein
MGGALERPFYLYGNNPAEFLGDAAPSYQREIEIGDELTYREWSFV